MFLSKLQAPLLVASYSEGDLDLGPLLSLCHLLRPDLAIQLSRDDEIQLLPGFGSYILFMPSEQALRALQARYHCLEQPLDGQGTLWSLTFTDLRPAPAYRMPNFI